jgi:uncharacterized protein YecA (UPF0149 family)
LKILSTDDSKLLGTRLEGLTEVHLKEEESSKKENLNNEEASYSKLRSDLSQQSQSINPSISVSKKSETPKVGRNDECPCGSGKKFKVN